VRASTPTQNRFCPRLVDLDVDARDKSHALDIAARTFERAYRIDATAIADALERREATGSTGVGNGVAFPHARMKGLAAPLTMLLRVRKPIDFDAFDAQPVTLILVILMPAVAAARQHLDLLAHLAALFDQETLREGLVAARDHRAVGEAFAEAERALGATEREDAVPPAASGRHELGSFRPSHALAQCAKITSYRGPTPQGTNR